MRCAHLSKHVSHTEHTYTHTHARVHRCTRTRTRHTRVSAEAHNGRRLADLVLRGGANSDGHASRPSTDAGATSARRALPDAASEIAARFVGLARAERKAMHVTQAKKQKKKIVAVRTDIGERRSTLVGGPDAEFVSLLQPATQSAPAKSRAAAGRASSRRA